MIAHTMHFYHRINLQCSGPDLNIFNNAFQAAAKRFLSYATGCILEVEHLTWACLSITSRQIALIFTGLISCHYLAGKDISSELPQQEEMK